MASKLMIRLARETGRRSSRRRKSWSAWAGRQPGARVRGVPRYGRALATSSPALVDRRPRFDATPIATLATFERPA
jgi:hypothetical protein